MTDEFSNRDSAQAANSVRHLAVPSNGFLTARISKNSHAALTFANWSEAEAAQRLRKLKAAGWSPASIAGMFGIRIEEIDRLTGGDVIPEKDCAHVG